jgi:tetratricopeptide (TPR) repeat protein
VGGAKVGWTFGIDRAIERLERAMTFGEDRGDAKLVGDAYFWIAFARRMRRETPETSPQLKHAAERSAEIGAARGDPVAAALPNAFAGLGMINGGQLRAGARLLSESLGPLVEHADPLSAAILSGMLSMAYARLGDFAGAERAVAHAERIAASGDPIAALDVKIARSAILIERGDIAAGEALAATCATGAEELGALACVVAANTMAGMGHLARDDAAGAKGPLERGDELAEVSNMAPFRTLTQGMLGSVRSQLGDVPGGIAAWTFALDRAHATHDAGGEAMTLWQRARVEAGGASPDYAAALADVEATITLVEQIETRPMLARALRLRAQILRALGRPAEADADDTRSKAIAAELGLKDFAP